MSLGVTSPVVLTVGVPDVEVWISNVPRNCETPLLVIVWSTTPTIACVKYVGAGCSRLQYGTAELLATAWVGLVMRPVSATTGLGDDPSTVSAVAFCLGGE